MRLYGSSPLHNYVELIFRCKRLFIISIILGTVIVSAIVASRSDKYESDLIVALSGDPELTRDMSPSGPSAADTAANDAKRKANRLALWLAKTPDFLQEVIQDANVDRTHPGVSMDQLIKQVREAITGPTILNDQYMEVSIIWGNKKEADAILNALYSRFASRTVATETTSVTRKRQILEEEYKQFDADANAKARKRMQYMRDHYWQMPTLLTSEMTRMDQNQTQIASLQIDMGDTKVRLDEINRQLLTTPRIITESTSTTQNRTDPALALVAQKQDLETKLKQLLTIYSDRHPKVLEVTKNIAALDQQIKQVRQEPNPASETSSMTQRSVNPVWRDLQQQKSSLSVQLQAQQERLAALLKQTTVDESRVRQMPVEEVAYDAIERDYRLADTIRNNTQAALKAAQIDEERDTMTAQRSVQMLEPPKATRVDAPGKIALLYVLGPILGIIIAFCFSLALEALDHTLRTPVEVEQYLGKPVLAVIPRNLPTAEERKKLGGADKQSLPS
jgi:uncharacterized protein involved in exopolysaccharide biosynthesis